MENLFTTPETSREMQELGFPQKTAFLWAGIDAPGGEMFGAYVVPSNIQLVGAVKILCAAPTMQEV